MQRLLHKLIQEYPQSIRSSKLMIVKPKVRAFLCVTAHPEGCAAHIREQIHYVRARNDTSSGPKKVLVIGSSTGYGLASRIVSAFGYGAQTLGIFFERPSQNGKTASAGWYNTAAFEDEAQKAGLEAWSINGDAFSNEVKEEAIHLIKQKMGAVDLIIYSLAAPRRTDPATGTVYKSVIKPIGKTYSNKYLDTDNKRVEFATLEPATDEDIHATVKVMGGEDWALWINTLSEAGLLAKGVKTIAYDYIGPRVTWPIYLHGTIGKAKEHLKSTAIALQDQLKPLDGTALISVNKAVVTQASSAIPGVNLYITLLYKVMKDKGIHEGVIEQIERLFKERLYTGGPAPLDENGLIRIDDLEMRPDVQNHINDIWDSVKTENLEQYADFKGYQNDFLRLFGFNIDGIDYGESVEIEREIPSIVNH